MACRTCARGAGAWTLPCSTPGVAPDDEIRALPAPVQLYVGRVAVEKNIEAFLSSPHPGSKVVIGDGPARAMLATRYPDAHFLGPRYGTALAAAYAAADVFVFPSRTDTFGLVMIEALACGTPVAAYPVTGPVDVLTPETGAMDEDIATATARALMLDRSVCARYGAGFTWGGQRAAVPRRAGSGIRLHDARRLIGSILSLPLNGIRTRSDARHGRSERGGPYCF